MFSEIPLSLNCIYHLSTPPNSSKIKNYGQKSHFTIKIMGKNKKIFLFIGIIKSALLFYLLWNSVSFHIFIYKIIFIFNIIVAII